MQTNKTLLVILDGWGYAPAWGGNAIEIAETPNMDIFWRKYPHTTLLAAEEAVGLPVHEPGNSEVGHLNLGSGQIVRQNLPGITRAIEDKSFYKNQVLLEAINYAKKNNSNIHLMGLVSDGGVHSHISHLFALLDLLKREKFERVFIHVFTDGRDTDPMKSLSYLNVLQNEMRTKKIGQIATISGRYYAMDRDNRWERVQLVYDILTSGIGPQKDSAEKVISECYRQGKYDEFITPTIITTNGKPFVPIQDNDGVIFFNFRADRTKELTLAFVEKNFNGFKRRKIVNNLYFATFSYHEEYEEKLPVKVVFKLGGTLTPIAQVLSTNKLKQFHIAETEKYAHVTYFFNGGKEEPFYLENRLLVPSPKVATYDLKPEMSAPQITGHLLKILGKYDFIVVNYANPDMVGHTGNLKAAIRACEALDILVGRVVKEAISKKYTIIVTADHGNAEEMLNPNTGGPDTEHSINPVPFILISDKPEFQSPLNIKFDSPPKLSDVAPTILKIMNLEKPKDMTGNCLIQ
jgi:2,3-bisphosphoglycerate-independent phosphoglycerate mutase